MIGGLLSHLYSKTRESTGSGPRSAQVVVVVVVVHSACVDG